MACYSAVSVRKILEIAIRYESNKRISEMPQKKIITFNRNDTIGEILKSMFENKTRKLILENSNQFVSDRIIIGIIAQDKNYLRGIDDFLNHKINPSRLADAKEISQDLKIPEVSKIMFGMLHPYIIYKDQVITPWDLCMTLVP